MYPKRKDLFDAWHKAMVAGATVDKPNYGKSRAPRTTSKKFRSKRKGASRRRRKKNAQA